MYEIELKHPIHLEETQARLIDLHSALNVLTVISNEIHILSLLADLPPELERSKEHIYTLKKFLLEDQPTPQNSPKPIHQTLTEIQRDISDFIVAHPALAAEIDLPLFQRNLNSLFEILTLRHEELLRRNEFPLQWGILPVATLKDNLIHVFEAMELNSHGRYHIVYTPEQKEPSDYLLQIDILSQNGETMHIPLVLQDIMRDLSANARKYSQPGSKISTRLEESAHTLTLQVEDQGMGIPETELEKIVEFGERGSNAKEKRTMGGGFGLTKAWYFTHQLGGRMWLASQLNQGTRIRIEIPTPPPLESH